MKKVKWKYFKDRNGNISDRSIINGSELMRTLTDVYFELVISKDGRLLVEVEEESQIFFRKKKDKLYSAMYKKICQLHENDESAFYNEQTRTYGRLYKKVYSSIENEDW